jgi:cytochrome c oxidase cbb3-type subunit 3
MDEKWIYGDAIENIVATIREGRPNGMPSFRGRIPDDQIWQIAARTAPRPRPPLRLPVTGIGPDEARDVAAYLYTLR